jgi:hypothetical protein
MCKNESFRILLNIGWVFWIKEKRGDCIKFCLQTEKWTRIEKNINKLLSNHFFKNERWIDNITSISSWKKHQRKEDTLKNPNLAFQTNANKFCS